MISGNRTLRHHLPATDADTPVKPDKLTAP
jgi:hypothetical protein